MAVQFPLSVSSQGHISSLEDGFVSRDYCQAAHLDRIRKNGSASSCGIQAISSLAVVVERSISWVRWVHRSTAALPLHPPRVSENRSVSRKVLLSCRVEGSTGMISLTGFSGLSRMVPGVGVEGY